MKGVNYGNNLYLFNNFNSFIFNCIDPVNMCIIEERMNHDNIMCVRNGADPELQ